MKPGDTVPVTINGHEVAQATIKEINDGVAVLIVPATRVDFGIRTELTDLPVQAPGGTQTIIDGVDRQSAVPTEPTEVSTATPVTPAPTVIGEGIVETPGIDPSASAVDPSKVSEERTGASDGQTNAEHTPAPETNKEGSE